MGGGSLLADGCSMVDRVVTVVGVGSFAPNVNGEDELLGRSKETSYAGHH